MIVLLNPAVRNSPVRLLAGAFSRRHAASLTIGAFASLLFAPCGAFALSSPTLALSPQVAKSTLVSAMDPAKEIIIQFTLPLSDRQGARDLLKHVSTPKDPLYRHYITVQEFATRFGANAADYATVRAWAVANGLSIVHEATARTSLSLRGTVAQVQNLFKTRLNYYRAPSGDQFYSASVAPTVPSEIASKIQALIGLTGGVQKATQYKIGKILGENLETAAVRTDTAGGTGPGGAYSASDLRTAYQIPTFEGAPGQTVAVFEDSAISPSDFEKYLQIMHLPKIKLKQILVDQGTLKPNGDQVEAVLDVDMISAINPDVKEIQLYAATPITDNDEESQFSTDLIDVFDTVATNAGSPGGPQTLSVSYGLDEILMALGGGDVLGEEDALLDVGLAGVTVLVSAGDSGAYGDTGTESFPATLNVSDPGSQLFVTCVGGTSLFTLPGEVYGLETVWNELGYYPGAGATGGGVSELWELPPYQPASLVEINGGSGSGRNVPDVGAVGDPYTGVAIYVKAAGGWIQLGGTSVSAPIWGGYVSILNSGLQFLTGVTTPEVGFFNPLLYFTVAGDEFPAGLLHPVLEGSNGNLELYGTAGFNAGPSYNNCTGVGTVWGPFAYDVFAYSGTGTPTPPPSPANLTAKATATSVKITWQASSGATGYAVFVTAIPNGQTTFAASQTFITKGTKIDVKGLTAKAEYGIAVAAVNAGGASQSTTEVTTP